MFKDAKVGDRVWSVEEGFGTVEAITGGDYPLIVQFKFQRIGFTIDGKRWRLSQNPTLFWDKIKFEVPKKPLPNLEVDTPVLVWDKEGDKKRKRHFAEFDKNDRIICFVNGETSWSSSNGDVSSWNYWELAEDNTKDEK